MIVLMTQSCEMCRDGNLVIYAGKHGAVWATGTNGSQKIDSMAILATRHPALELRSEGRTVWHSQTAP